MSKPERPTDVNPPIEVFATDMTAEALRDLRADLTICLARDKIVNLVAKSSPQFSKKDIDRRLPIKRPGSLAQARIVVEHRDNPYPPMALGFTPLGFENGLIYGDVSAPLPIPDPIREVIDEYNKSQMVIDETLFAFGNEDFWPLGTLHERLDKRVEMRVAIARHEVFADGQVEERQRFLARLLMDSGPTVG